MRKYRNRPIADGSRPDSTAAYHSPEAFLDDAFWERNFHTFTLIAQRRILSLPWHQQFRGRASGGMEATDYVIKAAELLISGTRRCRIEYSRETCVHGVLDSLISHHSGDLENSFAHDSLSIEEGDVFAPVAAPEPSLEEAIASQEQLELYKKSFTEIQQRYLDLIASGQCESAADAAEALGVPESVIRSIVKVVRRRRSQWPGKRRR